ncbi:MAG: response regulator [Crocinitomicaceae bacterium]|nr:response regulator [Crocinitomicaceae bacterium]
MSKKIAVIEDNLEMRENIAELLELSNYNVVTASDGKQGVELVKSELPDLVICDIMMPGLDGYSVLYMLGQDPNTKNIPFLFLSAKADKDDFRKGMNLGADDYLTKPFTEMDLLNTVEKRIQKSTSSSSFNIENYFEATDLEKILKPLCASDQVKTKIINKRANAYFQGDSANDLFFVKKGLLRVYTENEDGKEFSIEILSEGDFFGVSGLTSKKVYGESVVVIEDVELCVIPIDFFVSELNKNAGLNKALTDHLIQMNDRRNKELVEMAYDTVRLRVSKVLARLNHKIDSEWIHMSREELASLVGTSTESVIRMLSEFKSDGIIEVKGTAIKILKSENLVDSRF